MGAHPGLGLDLVVLRAKHMEDGDDSHDGENVVLDATLKTSTAVAALDTPNQPIDGVWAESAAGTEVLTLCSLLLSDGARGCSSSCLNR